VVDDATLSALPADANTLEVIEKARRRMAETAEALNQMFMESWDIQTKE
jgi:hypothetical protein